MGKTSKNNDAKAKAPAKKTTAAKSSRKGAVGGPQKILDSVLFLETRSGNPNVSRKQVAAMAGVKSNTFAVAISGMKKKGLLEYDPDTIRLTDQGRAKANHSAIDIATDNASAQEEVKKKFKIGGGKPGLLFDALLDGRIHDRGFLIGSLGFGSKASAAVMLSNLKKNGVIEYNKTTIQMTDLCFPFGRPTEEQAVGNNSTESEFCGFQW